VFSKAFGSVPVSPHRDGNPVPTLVSYQNAFVGADVKIEKKDPKLALRERTPKL
jgi:hypothetical protein